jgi:RNA polymerase sigma factor (sigma-70 family)
MMRRVVRSVCAKRGLYAECDDLVSELALRLLDRDGAALKQFEGRGDFEGFLVRITQRLALDHRRRLWGRWRPSVSARRLGPAAVHLDRLLARDQVPAAEAVRHTALAFGIPEGRVVEMRQALGPTRPRRAAGLATPSSIGCMSAIETNEHLREAWGVRRALATVLRELGEEDRSLLRARYVDRQKIAAIADARGLPPKALYRRFERLHLLLREGLTASGVDRRRAMSVLDAGMEEAFAQPLLGATPDGEWPVESRADATSAPPPIPLLR